MLKKGKTPADISDELEEPFNMVELICTAVFQYGLETSKVDVYRQIENKLALI